MGATAKKGRCLDLLGVTRERPLGPHSSAPGRWDFLDTRQRLQGAGVGVGGARHGHLFCSPLVLVGTPPSPPAPCNPSPWSNTIPHEWLFCCACGLRALTSSMLAHPQRMGGGDYWRTWWGTLRSQRASCWGQRGDKLWETVNLPQILGAIHCRRGFQSAHPSSGVRPTSQGSPYLKDPLTIHGL